MDSDGTVGVCSMQSSMCFAVEGLMTTLFTPPGCNWSVDDNSVVDNSPPQPAPAPLSPRKVCSLWKKKRKAQKKRIMEMRAQEDIEFQSELKLSALGIQRSFERRIGDESDEEQQRASYEKYGSRAAFMRDLRL